MKLHTAYTAGITNALRKYGAATFPASTNPVMKNSPLLNSNVKAPVPDIAPSPQMQNQMNTGEAMRGFAINHGVKLSIDQSKPCTTCKQPQHYGSCKKQGYGEGKEIAFIRDRLRTAGFNMGMYGSDNEELNDMSHSSRYTSSTSDSGKSRARNTLPTAEQAASAQREFNKAYSTANADQTPVGRNSFASLYPQEQRGPTSNPYEQYWPSIRKGPPVAYNDDRKTIIDRAFRANDNQVDASSIENTGASGIPITP